MKRGDNTRLNRLGAKRPPATLRRAKCGLSIAHANIIACAFGRMHSTAFTNNRKIPLVYHSGSITFFIPRGRLCRAVLYRSFVKRFIRRAIRLEWILTTGINRLPICADKKATIVDSYCVNATTRQFTALVANLLRVY